MAYKRLLILGGALLLAAGCSTSTTAPMAKVGGSAVNAKTNTPTTLPRTTTMTTESDSTACRGNWPLTSGGYDTTCMIEH